MKIPQKKNEKITVISLAGEEITKAQEFLPENKKK
jgi:hypothetical protein